MCALPAGPQPAAGAAPAAAAAAAAGCADAEFRIARGLDVGGYFAAADLNGDTRPDLAWSDGVSTVTVQLNDGTGRFGTPTRYATGSRPTSVISADFNSDGRPDLATANSAASDVSILLGSGGGAFAPATSFAAGVVPRSLAAGDFNSDGRLDLAVSSLGSGAVSALLGDGAGGFALAGPPTSLANNFNPNPNVYGVAVADFDSDGKLDLAVATLSVGHHLMKGDGAGGFSAPSQVGSEGAFAVASADLNGDGKADLLLGTLDGMTARLGDGAGAFHTSAAIARDGGGSVEAVALGDIDGDGKTDAAVAGSVAGLTYFKGDGAGGFSRTRSYLAKSHPVNLAVGDFDGDGDRDLFAGSSLLLNAGGGVFDAASAFYSMNASYGSVGPIPTDLAVGDFNGDGRADMAVSRRGLSGMSASVAVMIEDGAGGYNVSTPFSFSHDTVLNRLVAADFNKDGMSDLAVAVVGSQPFSSKVVVSLGKADGTFAVPIHVGGVGQTPWDLAPGDFNADGDLDIVVVSGGSESFAILSGDGGGNFHIAAAHDVGTRYDRVAVGDFDGDGRQDFALNDSGDKQVLVMRSEDGGTFSVVQTVTLPISPSLIVSADFNADGRADLAVAGVFVPNGLTTGDGSLWLLLNDGAGAFAAPVNYRVSSTPVDMAAADLNGDGKTDLAVGTQQPSAVYALTGDGAGGLTHAAVHDFPAGRTAIAAHDFDGDSRADLAGIAETGAVGVLFSLPPAPRPCLFADDATVTEGDSGVVNADVTVRLSEPSAQTVRVDYALSPGEFAVEGRDFAGRPGTLTFAPGETAKVVTVPVNGDAIHEFDESVTLTLSSPVNARISDGAAKLTIRDNEAPPSASINDVSVKEGPPAGGGANFTVTLSGPSEKVVKLHYNSTPGTATAGVDFVATPNPVAILFEPGTTTKTVSVSAVGDNTYEPDETFFVNLSDPADSTIADGQGAGVIIDDDPLPSVTAFSASATEAAGANVARVGVRLSNPSSQPISVDYATADGSAQADADYVAASGTLTFAPGETDRVLAITIKDDALDEASEEFFVNFSNPTNATVAVGRVSCLVIDNDGPAVSINDVSVVEGQNGRVSATFTLGLSAPSPETVQVRARTTNGTAEGGPSSAGDYQSVTGRSVIFLANTTTTTFTVLVNGDAAVEPDETFFADLSEPRNCTIADSRGVGTIVNDDVTSVRFDADTLTVSEKDGSLRVGVTRVGDLSAPFAATYLSFDATASQRSDYNDVEGTLRFGPGESSKTFTVFITDDALVEGPEFFNIMLTAEGGAAVNTPSEVRVNITSDDETAGPNPIGSTEFFVRQHYRDFLSREPDADGLRFWTNEIESCGADAACREVKRVNVSAAFFLSIEFQETGYLVYRAFKAAFNDHPGSPVPVYRGEMVRQAQLLGSDVVVGADGWREKVEQNKQAYFDYLVSTSRFATRFPASMTPEQFVDKLNANAGGALSAPERDALVAELKDDSKTRAQALRRVAEDEDLSKAEFNKAFVLMQYFGYLRRDPDGWPDDDFGGWNFWLGKLNEFGGDYIEAEMVKAFLNADEYRNRFGQ